MLLDKTGKVVRPESLRFHKPGKERDAELAALTEVLVPMNLKCHGMFSIEQRFKYK